MEGKINVKRTARNTIFVRWDSLRAINQDNRHMVSPPFTLTIDGYAIPLALSIECQENFIIRIHQNSLKVGRGIAFVAVKSSSHRTIDTMKTYLIEKWGETCAFYYFGTLLKNKYSSYSLTVDCKLMWLGFVNDIEIQNPSLPASVAGTAFSNTKVFPDLTIIVEGQEIPSHKAILARESSVFLSMFETPMKELKENKVIIEDIECSTMKILLKIIYTRNTEDLTDVDVILKILYAAEKYHISTIKNLCECKLQLLIEKNNVLKLLEMGNKYRALELCETCITYIMAINNEEISMEFKRLSEEMPNIGSAAAKVMMDLSSLVPYVNIPNSCGIY